MGGLFGVQPDIFGPQGLLGLLGLAGPPKQPNTSNVMTMGANGMTTPAVPQQQANSMGGQMAPQLPTVPPKPGFNAPGGWGEKLQSIGAQLRDNPDYYNQFLAAIQKKHHEAQVTAAQAALGQALQAHGLSAGDAAALGADPNAAAGLISKFNVPDKTEDPESVRVAQWYQKATPEQRKAFDDSKGPIIFQQNGNTTAASRSYVNGLAGGGGTMPHASDAASYAAIPPGTQYTTPDGTIRTKPMGGGSGNAAGGFPGVLGAYAPR